MPQPAAQLIDDAAAADLAAANGARWRVVTDRVMGGVSDARLVKAPVDGRPTVHLTARVRLENNGGFAQMALDLAPDGAPVDASGWQGVELTLRGNGEAYNVHLRTADIRRPWQSYRHGIATDGGWQTVRLPFAAFRPHRIDAPLDPGRLTRIGVVAIGRAFAADVALAELRFYG
jgi:hypothetical protein